VWRPAVARVALGPLGADDLKQVVCGVVRPPYEPRPLAGAVTLPRHLRRRSRCRAALVTTPDRRSR
jgi:hypothetical protein